MGEVLRSPHILHIGITMAQSTTSKSSPKRSKGIYIGSVVILVIVVVAFVFSPIAGGLAAPGEIVFGVYDGEEIVWSPGGFLEQRYQAIASAAVAQAQEEDTFAQIRIARTALRSAFNETVSRIALLQVAERSGMRVSEAAVDDLLAASPRFMENGTFSVELYRATSNAERFALRRLEREFAITSAVPSDVVSGTRASDAEAQFVAAMAGPERSFEVVRFEFADFPATQQQAFAAENPDLFATLDLSVATAATQEEAQTLRDDLIADPDGWDQIVRERSRDAVASEAGALGELLGHEVERILIDPAQLTNLLALAAGELSPVIESTSGWSIYRPNSQTRPFDPQGDLAAVAEYMNIFEQGLIQDFAFAQAETFGSAARDQGFINAAANTDEQVLETPFFPINYGNFPIYTRVQSPDIDDLADAAFREEFFRTAFSLAEGEISEPIVLRQSVVVLRLREVREAPAPTVDRIANSYPFLLRELLQQELTGAFIDQSLLDDRFDEVFPRWLREVRGFQAN